MALWSPPDKWEISDLPGGVELSRNPSKPQYDVVIAFFTQKGAIAASIVELQELIRADGRLWLAWPRRAGGHTSDVTDNLVREVVLPTGLVDTKVAALDRDWSALQFVWRKELRAARQ